MNCSSQQVESSTFRPENPWQIHPVEIRARRNEIAGVDTYDLAFRDPVLQAGFRFLPGQFNMLYLPGAGEIAISISDDPRNRSGCLHTIRVAGNVTGTLARLEPGDTLGLRGPFGTSWPVADCEGRDVVLVTGGIGLAPIRPVIYSLLHQPEKYGKVYLLHGGRSPSTLLYAGEYNDWMEHGLNVQTTVDRAEPGWNGNVGVVTLLMERLRGIDPANTILLSCGPDVMMRFAVKTALGLGIAAERIWVSLERNMQCAVGLCGHCQLGPEFICKDGPVFRLDRIAPFVNVEGL